MHETNAQLLAEAKTLLQEAQSAATGDRQRMLNLVRIAEIYGQLLERFATELLPVEVDFPGTPI
jgi:hypothetical protein